MTKDEFTTWMDSNQFTITQTANQLDLSIQSIRNYKNGRSRIPKVIELACISLNNKTPTQVIGTTASNQEVISLQDKIKSLEEDLEAYNDICEAIDNREAIIVY